MPRNMKQKRQFHFLYSSLTVRLKLRCTSSPIGSHFLQKGDINCPSSAWESHCFHVKLKQGCVFHHPLAKARNVAVRNVTAVNTSRESTTCTPAPPRDVWALSNPAIRSHTHTLTSLFAILFLSLSNSHTLFSKPICPWGAYAMQRSNTNFTACARYNLIFCAGEMEEWAKKRKAPTNKQLKSLWQLLDGNFPITLFPFDLILSKVQLCKYSIPACRTCFPFISATVIKKNRHTDADWICPSRGFQSVIISEFRLLDF